MHNGILPSHGKEQNPISCSKVDGPEGHCVSEVEAKDLLCFVDGGQEGGEGKKESVRDVTKSRQCVPGCGWTRRNPDVESCYRTQMWMDETEPRC